MSTGYYQQMIVRRTRLVAGQHLHAPSLSGYIISFLVLLLFAGLGIMTGTLAKKPEMVVMLAAGVTVVLSVIRWPVFGTYISVALAILFDVFPNAFVSTPISEAGIFRNLSTRGLPEAVFVSLFEIIVLLTLGSVLVRSFHARHKLARGPLYRLTLVFGAVVIMGELNGILLGGDFKISLYEVRPLLYLVLLYVLAVNTLTGPQERRTLLWLTAIVTLVRCFEGVYRYFKMPGDVRSIASVVLEHDDSLFLVVAVGLLVGVALWRRWLPRNLLYTCLAMIPFVMFIMVINGRRAVFLCVFLLLATYVPLVWISLRSRKRRLQLIYVAIACAVIGPLYLAAFWNKEGGIAQPAAALRSVINPSERDYLSNLYRDQENANLRYTIDNSSNLGSVLGIGFGRKFLVVVPMVDVSAEWALQLYMPHNNMLWLWLRMGIIGFVIFWVMMGAAIVLVGACVRLGVARLRVLASQEREELARRAADWTAPPPSVPVPTGQVGLYRVRCTTPHEVEAQRAARDKSVHMLLGGLSREGQECAEFLVLSFVALATLVSLLSLGVVDQGLMSFRLTAYAGVIMGAQAAAWNSYSVQYRHSPELLNVEPIPKEEDTVRVPRRRVRYFARA